MILGSGVTDPDQFRRRMGAEEVHRFLLDRLHSLPQANSISLQDNAGMVVNSSRAWPVPIIDASSRDFYAYWREHNDPGAFIGVPIVNKISGAWVIMVTRRVSGPSGEFLGIIAGVVELRYFEDFYQVISTEEGKAVSLFRRDGTLIETIVSPRDTGDKPQRYRTHYTFSKPETITYTLIRNGQRVTRQQMVRVYGDTAMFGNFESPIITVFRRVSKSEFRIPPKDISDVGSGLTNR